ncbi:MAG TPA: metallophosphoesterase, partial [Candidatus Acidoferrales bacterium]|nr:metallophosphoesterase [Candidatus Acidoferrales bacterium]
MEQEPQYRKHLMNILFYEYVAWPDFIRHQLEPFGSLPVFLTIGNHEVMPPKARSDYLVQFADWLDAPAVRERRLRDDPNNHQVRTYFHWMERHVDFLSLDNATPDQLDQLQVRWFESVLKRDDRDAAIQTLVVGMHEPLPDTISTYNMAKQFDGMSYTGFDTGARFECTQPIPERIAKKDARNDCKFFEFRMTVEKDTSPLAASSVPATLNNGARPGDAR